MKKNTFAINIDLKDFMKSLRPRKSLSTQFRKIYRWSANFKQSCIDSRAIKHSGRPECQLHETTNTLMISEGSVHTILHEHLSMRKVRPKCLVYLLTY